MILFAHGMGHSYDHNYWKQWAAPLRAELARKDLHVPEEQWDGVYYYDLVPGPKGKTWKAEGMQAQMGALRERAVQELSALRSPFAKGIEVIKKLSDHIVDNFGDIISYLYFEKTHQSVNGRIYEAINRAEEPVHLIGYSLGSIVSYCALQENERAAQKVAHLIILGSPLFWFKHGVAERVSFDNRPAVGRFTNIAGILDIAWPQAVPQIISTLDQHIEFSINPFDPIQGHQEYFFKEEGVKTIAAVLQKGWL